MPPSRSGDLFQGSAQGVDPQTPIGRLTRGLLAGAGVTRPLSPTEVTDAEEIQKDQTCPWCGGIHARACPRVKRLAYDPTGKNVNEVEFWAWGEWPEDHVVWPEDLVEKEDDDADAGSGA
jgi:hypothetical protein